MKRKNEFFNCFFGAGVLFALLTRACKACTRPPAISIRLSAGAARCTTDFKRSNDLAYAVARQADGKLVVAGIRFIGNSAEGGDFVVARCKPDGTLHRKFGRSSLTSA